MKHLFTGDPWYNTKSLGSGMERVGFRPGPVQVNLVRPLVGAPPTFGGNVQRGTATPLQGPSFVPNQNQVSYNPNPIPKPYNGIERKVPAGNKASCPVCRKFG